MDKLFKLRQLGTDVKREMIAGVTTFFMMIYIVVVNPAILSIAGVPFEQVFFATIIAIVIGILFMALWANLPVAVAPAMGMNAYFVNIVMTHEVSYETVFGAVLIAAILFLLLSLTHYREILIEAIPDTLKYSIIAGIGLYIAFLGLTMSEIIVSSKHTFVTIGDLTEGNPLLTIVGLLVTLILMVRNDKGAIFIGMLITGLIGYLTGLLKIDKVVAIPTKPDIIDFDLTGVFSNGLITVILAFLLITIINSTGTIGLLNVSTGIATDYYQRKLNPSYLADSVASTIGALLGTTPSTKYIESSSGIIAGGRSGLTSLVVAGLFLVTLFFLPLAEAVSTLVAITAPALIIIGCKLFVAITRIKWNEIEEAIPAFLVIAMIPLTGSIATGMAIGFIIHPIIQLAQGNGSYVHPIMYVFSIIFILSMVFTF